MLRQRPAGRPPPAKLQGQRCGARSRRIPPLQLPAQRSGQREQSAPLFGLTCASMHGMRLRWARHSGRFSALLLSGSVLLAFACFPVVAEADSAGTQYENEVPTPTGTHKVPGPSAQTSAVGGGASPRGHKNSGSGGGSSAGGSSSGRGNGGTGQGSPQNGSDKRPSGQLQETGQGSGSAPASAEAGSSPLLPILLAIAALAGISIGVVTMRQRRRRHATGTPVSPKAG